MIISTGDGCRRFLSAISDVEDQNVFELEGEAVRRVLLERLPVQQRYQRRRLSQPTYVRTT
jgi:hypothetical protein